MLDAAYAVVTAAAKPGQRIAAAEAWLLDNFYLIEQQISLARRHLPPGYSRELPKLIGGASAGFPRIYALALELISNMDGRVDSDNSHRFIAAYQRVEPLKLGELWAFPIMLQLALLENLRRVSVRIAQRREERDAAIDWTERMLATAEREPGQLIHLLAEFAKADVPLTAPFVEAFYERLQPQAPAMAFIQTWLEHTLLEQGVTATTLSDEAGRMAATNQISIANSVGSLRFIGSMDWQTFVETQSAVEHALRDEPMGCHARQNFATRDRYRHIVEDIARYSPANEIAVANAAIVLAQAAAAEHGPTDRRAHVGYSLIDAGRPALERAVGSRLPWRKRLRRATRPYRLALYLGAILGLTALAAGGMAWLSGPPDGYAAWLLALPLILSASALALPLVNLWVPLLLAPRALPRLDFSSGIPPAHRTMVVVPTLIATPHDVDELLEALEIRYLGNRDANLFFALLTDFHDAPEQSLPTDAALLAHAAAAIEELNARYEDDRPGIFYWLHRPRSWNPVERVWMGYERKRGKLEQFNARLRDSAVDAFSEMAGDLSRLPSIRYVITLDTDTQLPRDTARSLVGTLAHPLNRPVFDAALGRISEGYAILQPRAAISLVSAGQSRFSRLFAGDSGLDPYTREVSDTYQDIFGEGSFIGKGIYDVDAFRQAVDGRFPENLILSHDLLESGYARSALVSDIELIETHPASYTIDASRRHRWIRGDWQLTGWLLPRVHGGPAAGSKRLTWQKNPLSALSRWKLLDNLRRSLVSPALLSLLAGGWLLGAAGLWTLWVVAVIALPGLLASLIALLKKPAERDLRIHLRLTAEAAQHPLALAVLSLTFLPYDARVALGAIARSALRRSVTRRGLQQGHPPVRHQRRRHRHRRNFVGLRGHHHRAATPARNQPRMKKENPHEYS